MSLAGFTGVGPGFSFYGVFGGFRGVLFWSLCCIVLTLVILFASFGGFREG